VLSSVSEPRLVVLQLTGPGAVRAANKDKDEDRLKDCGAVLKEILDIPDDIPQGLLDKADCLVVYPSVLKAAFVVGGSYGRGAMNVERATTSRDPGVLRQ